MTLDIENVKNLSSLVSTTGWFKSWFDSSFYHQLYTNRNEKEAQQFVNQLIDTLRPDSNSRMLDLGCGSGRHSIHLASKGFQVTGLDLAKSSIMKARRSETPTLQFYEHDMRVSFGKNYFDYVFNFFTSFGYFDTQQENEKVLSNIATSLKQGGIAMIDYINVSSAEQNLTPSETKKIDGVEYKISRLMDNNHFFKKISIGDLAGNSIGEFTERVAKLRMPDFMKMFTSYGLDLVHVFGNYMLNKYEVSSPRLIMIGRKK